METAVGEAIGARTWLDAAQQRWEEQRAVAMHALSCHGFSGAEPAKPLGIADGCGSTVDIKGGVPGPRGRGAAG